MLSMEMLLDAQRILDPVINHTPVVSTKDIVPDCDFYLKADCLQKTGAFKLRGAYYKIATLSDEEKARGVIACSAGNHAQGVAFAARDMGIPATICIPEGAPLSKIEATRSYGAMWCWCPVCTMMPIGRLSACETRNASHLSIPSMTIVSWPARVPLPWSCTGSSGLRHFSGAYRRRRAHFRRGFCHQASDAPVQGHRRAGGRRRQHGGFHSRQ